MPPPHSQRNPRAWIFCGLTLLLYLFWSNSFIAIGWLLGSEQSPARLTWTELTLARFAPVTPLCALYCFGWQRHAALALVRDHWRRLCIGGFCAVPLYNFALYYGQAHGVPAPVASILTATSPLFLMINARLFLGEALALRKIAGFVVALLGLTVIARAKADSGQGGYGWALFVTLLAPLSWSFFSVTSKPLAGRVSPVLWTFLALTFGGAPLFIALPWHAGSALLALDGSGWGALLFLALGCTLLGFSLWVWLLRYLPASTVGFTVFLNPPLTALSKVTLASLFPALFHFQVLPLEWAGGALVLCGLGVALLRRQR